MIECRCIRLSLIIVIDTIIYPYYLCLRPILLKIGLTIEPVICACSLVQPSHECHIFYILGLKSTKECILSFFIHLGPGYQYNVQRQVTFHIFKFINECIAPNLTTKNFALYPMFC